MFTRQRLRTPELTGEDGPKIIQALQEFLLRLEAKDGLAIGQWVKWTPTLIGSTTAGTQTYTQQVGRFAEVGAVMFFEAYLAISAKDASIAGNALIGGLPVKSQATAIYGGVSIGAYNNINLTAGYSQLGLQLNGGGATQLRLFESGDNVVSQAVTVANLGAATEITFSGFYLT